MKIAIAGGTGLVGSALCDMLLADGHELIILTRNRDGKQGKDGLTYVEWLNENSHPEKNLEGVECIVNLAGESINNRWTESTKRAILQSRLDASSEIARLISKLDDKPRVYIQASAIGYYGTSETDQFTEKNSHAGSDFLAHVVSEWEKAGEKIDKQGVRTVYMRFGVILDNRGGALPRMVLPYKLFAGGNIGSGNQWLSWIHIDDVCRLILFAIENETMEGAVNATSPNPKKMGEFGKTIGSILHRPHWIPLPAFVLKALLGEMSMLVLEGQYVYPEKAVQHGFQFQYENLQNALQDLL
ncbi:TIGR01777 family protein [Pueribacillus theae]|uniref:TIGR01777 family protein n=1 Tax=Pueribacillus theae TaxID=2171751 RepID=A0A2U1JVC0_9BACI|nr:TIGR01777 family oxidoreductase [Pueribacillus theae]PWA08778.1 TIGR01777 family protein [Pueribacillus theae]